MRLPDYVCANGLNYQNFYKVKPGIQVSEKLSNGTTWRFDTELVEGFRPPRENLEKEWGLTCCLISGALSYYYIKEWHGTPR